MVHGKVIGSLAHMIGFGATFARLKQMGGFWSVSVNKHLFLFQLIRPSPLRAGRYLRWVPDFGSHFRTVSHV
jgi:hypothetical protein